MSADLASLDHNTEVTLPVARDNMIKNHFNTSLQRQKRRQKNLIRQRELEGSPQDGPEANPSLAPGQNQDPNLSESPPSKALPSRGLVSPTASGPIERFAPYNRPQQPSSTGTSFVTGSPPKSGTNSTSLSYARTGASLPFMRLPSSRLSQPGVVDHGNYEHMPASAPALPTSRNYSTAASLGHGFPLSASLPRQHETAPARITPIRSISTEGPQFAPSYYVQEDHRSYSYSDSLPMSASALVVANKEQGDERLRTASLTSNTGSNGPNQSTPPTSLVQDASWQSTSQPPLDQYGSGPQLQRFASYSSAPQSSYTSQPESGTPASAPSAVTYFPNNDTVAQVSAQGPYFAASSHEPPPVLVQGVASSTFGQVDAATLSQVTYSDRTEQPVTQFAKPGVSLQRPILPPALDLATQPPSQYQATQIEAVQSASGTMDGQYPPAYKTDMSREHMQQVYAQPTAWNSHHHQAEMGNNLVNPQQDDTVNTVAGPTFPSLIQQRNHSFSSSSGTSSALVSPMTSFQSPPLYHIFPNSASSIASSSAYTAGTSPSSTISQSMQHFGNQPAWPSHAGLDPTASGAQTQHRQWDQSGEVYQQADPCQSNVSITPGYGVAQMSIQEEPANGAVE